MNKKDILETIVSILIVLIMAFIILMGLHYGLEKIYNL